MGVAVITFPFPAKMSRNAEVVASMNPSNTYCHLQVDMSAGKENGRARHKGGLQDMSKSHIAQWAGRAKMFMHVFFFYRHATSNSS